MEDANAPEYKSYARGMSAAGINKSYSMYATPVVMTLVGVAHYMYPAKYGPQKQKFVAGWMGVFTLMNVYAFYQHNKVSNMVEPLVKKYVMPMDARTRLQYSNTKHMFPSAR